MRRRLWAVLAIVLCLGIAHLAYWRILQSQVAESFSSWAANARAAGWKIDARTSTGGGWPLAAKLVLINVVVSSGKGGIPVGNIYWQSPRVILKVGLGNPHRLELEAEGIQHLRIGESGDIPIEADRLHATLSLQSDGTPEAVDILAKRLTSTLRSDNAQNGRMIVGLLQAHSDLLERAEGLGFSMSAEAVDLPAGVKWPLGPRISSFSVEGTASGRPSGSSSPAEWVKSWRDSGGALAIHRLAFGWGPLGASATATLALDDQLQPMGTGTAKLVGYPAALDALANNGTLGRSAVTAAKAILSLLAPAPGDGEPDEVEVPLTLQYRTLSIRQVPLLRLPEVDWGQP